MKKARYKYRVEINRWTWIAGASALTFLGILLVQILRDPPIFVTNVELGQPPDDVLMAPVGVYDPTEGTEPFYGMSGPPAGPETFYDPANYVPIWIMADDLLTSGTEELEGMEFEEAREEWYAPALIEAAPEPAYAPVIAIPVEEDDGIVEEAVEASAPPLSGVERILELIGQLLDRLVQLTTGLITLFGLWKTIKREKQEDPEPESEQEDEK